MPQINLLSPGGGSKTKKRTPLSADDPLVSLQKVSKSLITFSAIPLVVAVLLYVVFSISTSSKKKQLSKLEGQLKTLKVNPKQIQNLKKERAALDKKAKLIDELSSRKFYYYEKLELIADLIPEGVWLTQLQSRQQAVRPRSSEEKIVFTIKGNAVADTIDNAVVLIGDFIDNLKNNNDFAKDFVDIRLNNIAKGTLGSRDIMTFDLICETKQE